MLSDDSSDDEPILRTPSFLRKSYRNDKSIETLPSSVSSVRIETLSEDVLQIWSQLPEEIRLDPSLGAYQEEYERISEKTSANLSGRKDPNGEYLVLNLSISKPHKKHYSEEKEKLIDEHQDNDKSSGNQYCRYFKLIALIFCWLVFTFILMTKRERVEEFRQISISNHREQNYILLGTPVNNDISVVVKGSLLPPFKNDLNYSENTDYLTIWLELWLDDKNETNTFDNIQKIKSVSETWIVPLLPPNLINVLSPQKKENTFHLQNINSSVLKHGNIALNFRTTYNMSFPLAVAYDLSPINVKDGVIYAAIVLVGLYILIISEVIHRTLAAIMASTMSLALLASMNERPSMTELISWIDVDTLLLLFSMMILVAVFADTGIFDYLAVYAYKITGGKMWPLINTLCFFTAFISAFLDNVTTVLLMTPVTIRLCEVMQLNPVPILTTMVIYSNIGGSMTPVGDPPNVIIASNHQVINVGVDFSTFTMHMSIGVLMVIVVVYAQLRFIFRNAATLQFDEPQDVQELRHEISIWQRAAESLSSYSKDESLVRETLMKKVHRLSSHLNRKLVNGTVEFENYKTTLEELQEKYPIRDKRLLIKSGCALIFVITFFFLHSVPQLNLSLGWTALLGALLLLVLADSKNLDGVMARVEWNTLLFFASLFILMEALSQLGLIAWIGKQTEKVILSVNEDSRLAVAILLLLWVSAFASAFVDNVPLTTMMVRIVTNLAANRTLGLPLQPLVWALAFGACMGGNGTLIGATANVVCAGVAEQHGYRFTFMQFFKVGFPVMITSTATVTVYLMIAHVLFDWNGEGRQNSSL